MGMNIEYLYLDIGPSRVNTRCLKLYIEIVPRASELDSIWFMSGSQGRLMETLLSRCIEGKLLL